MVLIVMAHNSGGRLAREVAEKVLEEGLVSEASPDAVIDPIWSMSASHRS